MPNYLLIPFLNIKSLYLNKKSVRNITSIICLLFITGVFFSCEKDANHNHDSTQEVCEMCNSHCCEQLGTENCCCAEM